jgi:hypothetical protein
MKTRSLIYLLLVFVLLVSITLYMTTGFDFLLKNKFMIIGLIVSVILFIYSYNLTSNDK